MKTCTLVSALALAIASPALAQQPTAVETPSSSTTFVTTAEATDMRTSQWIGAPVRNGSDETVGDINDFVIGNDGSILAVVAGVGGFLGIGEKYVGLPFKNIDLVTSADGKRIAMVTVSKQELMNAPEFKTGEKTIRDRAKEASDAAGKTYEKAKENMKAGYESAKQRVKENYDAAKDAMTTDEKKPADATTR